MKVKLTEPFVRTGWKKYKPAKDRIFIWDELLPSFGLMITAKGHLSYVVQYRVVGAAGAKGRSRRMKLGTATAEGLEKARNAAKGILGKIGHARALGESADPLGERQAAEAKLKAARELRADAGRLTLKKLFAAYTRSARFRSNRRHEIAAQTIANHLVPRIGDRNVFELTRQDISAVIKAVSTEVGPGAAQSVFSKLRAALHWYAAADKEEIADLPGDNATFVVPITAGMAPPKSQAKERVLSDDEIRKLWHAAGSQGQFGRFVRFLLLTGLRRDEARMLVRAEIAEDRLEIPGARYKTKRSFVLPLSSQVRAILAEALAAHEYDLVFANERGKPLDHSRLKPILDKAAGLQAYTLHDLRRSARSIMSRIGVLPDIGERVGTLMVEDYERPIWTYNKLIYIEKEGFSEALKDERWSEKHDCALLSSKGFTTRAARDLVDLLADHDEPVTIFCVHDADAHGTMIYETFQEATKARGARKIKIINLGLEAWEALEIGLEVETVPAGERWKPVAAYVSERKDRDWSGWYQTHRVELNAMTTPQFIAWLDSKMKGYSKLVPPDDAIESDLEGRIDTKLRAAITAHILREARFEEQVASAKAAIVKPGAAALKAGIQELFEDTPDSEWRDYIEAVANDLTKGPETPDE
jgi:integrase